jgi:hypothetical protein
MRTAEFSLPPLVNLKPTLGAKQPNVLPQGVNLTNLIPDSFTRASRTEMATVNESASLRSGASLKQTIGMAVAMTAATLGTVFAGSAEKAFAHGSSTQALQSVVTQDLGKLALKEAEAPVVKALEATAGGAVKSGEYLLANHHYRHPQPTRYYHYNRGGYNPPPTHYRDYPQNWRRQHPQQYQYRQHPQQYQYRQHPQQYQYRQHPQQYQYRQHPQQYQYRQHPQRYNNGY